MISPEIYICFIISRSRIVRVMVIHWKYKWGGLRVKSGFLMSLRLHKLRYTLTRQLGAFIQHMHCFDIHTMQGSYCKSNELYVCGMIFFFLNVKTNLFLRTCEIALGSSVQGTPLKNGHIRCSNVIKSVTVFQGGKGRVSEFIYCISISIFVPFRCTKLK